MRQTWHVAIRVTIFALILSILTGVVWAQETTEEPPAETTQEAPADTNTNTNTELATYTIRPGDTLFSIARRFNTTTTALATENGIVNPRLIFYGQVLRIPGTATTPNDPAQPEPPVQPTGDTYIVRAGDTLYRIAIRNGTTVATLVALNNLSNPNRIFVGQTINLPAEENDDSTTETTTTPTTTEEPTTTTDITQPEPPARLEDAGFAMGIEAFMPGQDINILVNQITTLGMEWVKVRVDWRDIEETQGSILFTDLDAIVDALNTNNLQILFHVTNSPTWARETIDENGPPDDLANFGAFMTQLVGRYQGRVDAYEIWDEPNLRRNWNCNRQLCDTDYLDLLRTAYNVINTVDADALVISAGLAPTGFNDGINAIDDRLYLRTLYANGLRDVTDAVGIHAPGWANPPDSRCCEASEGVETHFESPLFYFLENIEAYRVIMVENGDGARPMWVTKFGWGTSEDVGDPSAIHIFVSYTSLAEQAEYNPRAFEIGNDLGFIGPMFLDNLNGCQGLSYRIEVCYNSLLDPNGAPRPVFGQIQLLSATGIGDNITEPIIPPEPEATTEPNP